MIEGARQAGEISIDFIYRYSVFKRRVSRLPLIAESISAGARRRFLREGAPLLHGSASTPCQRQIFDQTIRCGSVKQPLATPVPPERMGPDRSVLRTMIQLPSSFVFQSQSRSRVFQGFLSSEHAQNLRLVELLRRRAKARAHKPHANFWRSAGKSEGNSPDVAESQRQGPKQESWRRGARQRHYGRAEKQMRPQRPQGVER